MVVVVVCLPLTSWAQKKLAKMAHFHKKSKEGGEKEAKEVVAVRTNIKNDFCQKKRKRKEKIGNNALQLSNLILVWGIDYIKW